MQCKGMLFSRPLERRINCRLEGNVADFVPLGALSLLLKHPSTFTTSYCVVSERGPARANLQVFIIKSELKRFSYKNPT